MEDSWKLFYVFGIFVFAGSTMDSSECGFPAMYNFGDSNSDTGGISAAFTEIPSPNGETFFGSPTDRVCDGHHIIDFIVHSWTQLGTNIRHGANFATGSSSVRPPGYSPFNLGVQIHSSFNLNLTPLLSTINLASIVSDAQQKNKF